MSPLSLATFAKMPGEAMEWLGQHIAPHMPVVAVLGNHDHYGGSLYAARRDAKIASGEHGVHLLLEDTVEIDGIHFVGTTLWTDYRIGCRNEEESWWAMHYAQHSISDHSQIYAREVVDGIIPRLVNPSDLRMQHEMSVRELHFHLAQLVHKPTVVLTHHAPHPSSIHPIHEGNKLNGAYVSDLTGIIETYRPDLWIHGHTHDSFDYVVDHTRIVCNPRSFDSANPHFDPALIVEVDTTPKESEVLIL